MQGANAAAAAGWSISNMRSVGANVLATATRGGLRSAVNIVPNALRIARFGFSLRSPVSLVLFVADMNQSKNNATGVKDVKLENGLVKYTAVGVTAASTWNAYGHVGATAEEAANSYCRTYDGATYLGQGTGNNSHRVQFKCNSNGRVFYSSPDDATSTQDVPVTLPVSDFTNQVVSAAARGNDFAQGFLQDVAKESVMAGDFDADLMAGAVPIADDKPVVPVSPPPAIGDYEDSLVTGGDVGGQVASALDRLESARKAAAAALASSTAAADAARAAADRARDVIGSSVEQSIKDAAQASADAAAAASDRARATSAAAADAVQAAAQDVIDKARLGSAAAAGSVAQAQSALAAAQAAGDTAAAAAASAALANAQSVAAAMAAAHAKALEALKDSVASSNGGARDLPAFCRWATPVCDAVDYFKRDPAAVAPMPVDVTDTEAGDVARFDVSYIDYGSQCPALSSSVISVGIVDVPLAFDLNPLCDLARAIRPAVLAVAYFVALGIIASSIRDT